ncbi:MAG: PAS domain S-box protein, partial [Acidobacteria bacterium]|nr:PAS domain S-box protein [Acidobacteriota bacterium]
KKLIGEWQSCLDSGTPVDTEARIRRFDGSHRWCLIRSNPLRDDSGNLLKWYGTCVDIEDRKRGEEALRARELSWKQIVDNIPGLVATTGARGEVEFLNQQTLEYFGKTSEALKDWALIDAVHPHDVARVIEARKKSIEKGQIYEIEHRCRRADGLYRWFQVRGLPVRDTENEITSWYLLLTDINDRKQAEEELRQSEERARLIVDSIDALIMTATAKGEVEFVNQQVLDYFGMNLEELKGWATSGAVHRDDLHQALAWWTHSVETGDPYQFEERLRRADGVYRWFLAHGRCLRDTQDNVVRWYVLLTDIDDRKRAEAQVEEAYLRLAEAQRLSKTGSFITDLMTDDHNWSEEAFRIFEFDPSIKITLQKIREVIHPEDLPTVDAVLARAMTGAEVDFMFRIVPGRGGLKHVRGMARLMAQTGSSPLFIGALQDVTDSKIAEEALDKARSELAHVARVTMLNTLTASIAHEINQPLAGIVTNASTCLRMLSGDPPNIEGARETARRTIRDGNRASDVITRLRALYSKKEFTPELLDLNQATGEVIALSLTDLQRNGVVLRSDLAAHLPLVIGDRVQLQQVTLNLIRNASEAMAAVEDRPRQLMIRTWRDGDDRVCLSVRDSGTGISPEDFNRLFESFYTTKVGGMGIGLSVSRSIIERHQGRLWAEPNEGPGATFSLSIPCGPQDPTGGSALGDS